MYAWICNETEDTELKRFPTSPQKYISRRTKQYKWVIAAEYVSINQNLTQLFICFFKHYFCTIYRTFNTYIDNVSSFPRSLFKGGDGIILRGLKTYVDVGYGHPVL